MNAMAGPNPIHVLLVEDSPVDVLLFMDILRGALPDFSVESVSCLREALAKLDAGGVDVVISDLGLPDSTGMDTFHQLAAHRARVPIVLMTGLNDEVLALSMMEEGAQDYLVKGQFDQALLVRSIRYAIKRAEAERRVERERNLLRSVIDNIPDAIYVKDSGGRYLLDNAAHMQQIGVSRLEDLVGKTCADFVPAQRAALSQTEDSEVIETGRSQFNSHELLTLPGGARRWFSSTKVPLRDVGGEIIGMIRISHDITARKETEEKLAVSMRELREKNAEMEDDLNMAREVQLAFLPQQSSVFPRRAAPEEVSLRFVSRYLPTTTLGGDFFHILPISETEVGVFICDVMGHGVRAALVTAIARALAEELEAFAADPGEFLTQMNASMVSILRRTRSPMFASGFYMVVNVEHGRLRFANAGHPCPLHLKRDRDTLSFLEGPGARTGPALGVFEDSSYRAQSIKVAQRDLVVLYTDGLYEVEGVHGDFFDRERLLKTLGSHMQNPTEVLFEHTLHEVRGFSASGAFIDDVCLVGVEVERIGACSLVGCESPG
jgi:sigma-B regulation protein RsbU (phosphoserine phosphatase)